MSRVHTIVAIRPEPGLSETRARLSAMDIPHLCTPLFAIAPLPWQAADAGNYDAVLIGSSNVIRHGGAMLEKYKTLPAYCAGPVTQSLAERSGWHVAGAGKNGLAEALALAGKNGHRRLLRPTAAHHRAIETPADMHVDTVFCYAQNALPLPKSLMNVLHKPAIILTHSGRALMHFEAEMQRAALPLAGHQLVAISPRIASLADSGWGAVCAAEQMHDTAMLALAAKLWQKPD